MRSLILVAHDIRSAHNVGSILRSCEGLGVDKVYLSGYTPYPSHKADERLPHEAAKVDRQIQKTALGAQQTLDWSYEPSLKSLIDRLRKSGYQIVGLEQTANSCSLEKFKPSAKLALICGSEVGGLASGIVEQCDLTIHIPMLGKKESFNVAVASAIALYHLRYIA